ncbi:hypothetical protein [Jannaschia seohaensis]|uniref:Uncharacterized protein n=1 Tax=Jannaschia seohaensis TaxID=475081 RepID=A0A2Y9BXY3_9RHOB|nr:hypothetical protein [Jannaschia seohaensis]PWJ21252.1 hypothetical protein BCF38_102502 [Jannaschia seohaensis]SSA41662.1 hypothetical protein SAMN05421539_102502 [Jannaschia seohaensis]
MTDTANIRYRPDGSIDTQFYLAKGRHHRSEAAHTMARQATRKSSKIIAVLAVLGLASFFGGGQV